MELIYILIAILGFLIFLGIVFYNRLVALRNNRENAFADIDVQLKQRLDLIPQLVETVKGYMKHEEKVLTEITEARSQAQKAQSIDEKVDANNRLSHALQGLNIQVEAYPDLKASQNFQQLQMEISDIENKIAAARRFFNSATRELNTAIESFPSNLIAGMFGFAKAPMFDLGESRTEAEKAPEVKF